MHPFLCYFPKAHIPTRNFFSVTSLLLIASFLPRNAFSNAKLLPGYYIANAGDTVSCKIEFNDWYTNPTTIDVFVNSDKKTLGVTDIKGFGVYGFGDYLTASVTYHTNPLMGIHVSDKYSDSLETRSVFLKTLVKGNYSLYELILPQRYYYFVAEGDGPISELVYRVRQKDLAMEEDQQYKTALNLLFVKEGLFDKYAYKISVVTYNNANLRSLVDLLNEGHTGVRTQSTTGKSFGLDVFAGGSLNLFPSSFDGLYAPSGKFASSLSFSGGLNLLYNFPSHFNKLKIGLSVAYGGYNVKSTRSGVNIDSSSPNATYTTTYTENLSIKSTTLMTNIYVMYFLNPDAKIRFYLKGGVAISLSLGNDIDVLDHYTVNKTGPIPDGGTADFKLITVVDKLPILNIGFGMTTGKNKIALEYYRPSDIAMSGYTPFKVGGVGLYYYYSIFK